MSSTNPATKPTKPSKHTEDTLRYWKCCHCDEIWNFVAWNGMKCQGKSVSTGAVRYARCCQERIGVLSIEEVKLGRL